jgi:hypothetical protein
MASFNFMLGQEIKIARTQQPGKITARTEYAYNESQYYVEFVDTKGEAVGRWYTEHELSR